MSKIQWNKVTWYSKLLAVIVFLLTFYIGYNLGKEDQSIVDLNNQLITPTFTHMVTSPQAIINDVTFACSGGKTIRAQFRQNDVSLELSDGRALTVPHAISADGARYATAADAFVFWTRGQTAFITEGTNGSTTYANCLLTK